MIITVTGEKITGNLFIENFRTIAQTVQYRRSLKRVERDKHVDRYLAILSSLKIYCSHQES